MSYRIVADSKRRAERLRDLLAMVMQPPPSVTRVMGWTAEQREHAEEWAGREHLGASDNPIRRIPKPDFLK